MKTSLRVWSYLAEFFLEWEIFQVESVEKNTFFWLNNLIS
jgi:hypothetical protein